MKHLASLIEGVAAGLGCIGLIGLAINSHQYVTPLLFLVAFGLLGLDVYLYKKGK